MDLSCSVERRCPAGRDEGRRRGLLDHCRACEWGVSLQRRALHESARALLPAAEDVARGDGVTGCVSGRQRRPLPWTYETYPDVNQVNLDIRLAEPVPTSMSRVEPVSDVCGRVAVGVSDRKVVRLACVP
jgi:hypothetical protein